MRSVCAYVGVCFETMTLACGAVSKEIFCVSTLALCELLVNHFRLCEVRVRLMAVCVFVMAFFWLVGRSMCRSDKK